MTNQQLNFEPHKFRPARGHIEHARVGDISILKAVSPFGKTMLCGWLIEAYEHDSEDIHRFDNMKQLHNWLNERKETKS